ncbi:MAG: hypothetical protein LBB94_05380 [Clostridiales bacterium]|jgi:hypothetical protein|nr:hypothetical protein [Clostridiales bacterium]
MLDASETYLNNILAPLRAVKAKFEIDLSPRIETASVYGILDPQQLVPFNQNTEEIKTSEKGLLNTTVMEPNNWRLDIPSVIPAPPGASADEAGLYGYWLNELSGADGSLSGGTRYSIGLSPSVPIYQLLIISDVNQPEEDLSGRVIADMDVRFYGAFDVLLKTVSVRKNAGNICRIAANITDIVTRVEIAPLKVSRPFSYPRISKVFASVVFESGTEQTNSLHMIKEIDPDSHTFPEDAIDAGSRDTYFTHAVADLLSEESLLNAYIGALQEPQTPFAAVDWVATGGFMLQKWEYGENNNISFRFGRGIKWSDKADEPLNFLFPPAGTTKELLLHALNNALQQPVVLEAALDGERALLWSLFDGAQTTYRRMAEAMLRITSCYLYLADDGKAHVRSMFDTLVNAGNNTQLVEITGEHIFSLREIYENSYTHVRFFAPHWENDISRPAFPDELLREPHTFTVDSAGTFELPFERDWLTYEGLFQWVSPHLSYETSPKGIVELSSHADGSLFLFVITNSPATFTLKSMYYTSVTYGQKIAGVDEIGVPTVLPGYEGKDISPSYYDFYTNGAPALADYNTKIAYCLSQKSTGVIRYRGLPPLEPGDLIRVKRPFNTGNPIIAIVTKNEISYDRGALSGTLEYRGHEETS